MSNEAKEGPRYAKGDDLQVIGGKGSGQRGEVFWSGPNKFGPGFRYGVKTAAGETLWVDEADVEPAKGPAPKAEPVKSGPALEKGTQVKIVRGRSGVGRTGEVFWTGASKYGQGHRYGVRDGDDTFWVDGNEIEVVAASPKKAADASEFQDGDFSGGGDFGGSAEFTDDDFPPFDDSDAPADDEEEFFDDDAPF